MAIADNNISELNQVDNGIMEYIQEINDLGYVTVMSCSGMKEDHYEVEKCPFICFNYPELSGDELKSYLRFLGDSLFNANWFIEFFNRNVSGYLPWGLNDSNIENRFKKLINNLKLRDSMKFSY